MLHFALWLHRTPHFSLALQITTFFLLISRLHQVIDSFFWLSYYTGQVSLHVILSSYPLHRYISSYRTYTKTSHRITRSLKQNFQNEILDSLPAGRPSGLRGHAIS